jgi:uridine phosphorylase
MLTIAVYNRIITVGDPARAERLAQSLEAVHSRIQSHRGFLTINGSYCGVNLSIVAIGMGYPNMDMFVREARAVVTGPMVIIR